MSQAVTKAKKFASKPWVAHLWRAQLRFGNRMGNQSAGAISYFSILAIVPLLMFAFSLLGMTLTILRPDWLDLVKNQVSGYLARNVQVGGNLADQINELIESYLSNWRGVGIIGLVSLAYAGSGWLGNLRTAIRAMWRPEWEVETDRPNFVVNILLNLGMLLSLLVGVGVTFTIGIAGTALSTTIAHWLHLEDLFIGRMAMKLVAFLLSVVSGWGLFLLIYWLLPRGKVPRSALFKGSLAAAVILALLQLGTGALFGVFGRNKAVAVFGPIIVLMLLFNLFGRLVLFVAAWIATTKQPAVAYRWNLADAPLRDLPDAETAPQHWTRADRERLEGVADDKDLKVSVTESGTDPLVPGQQQPRRVDLLNPDPDQSVPQDVAVKTVRAGMMGGYVVGAATGLGVGAAIARALMRVFRR